ncbi:T9SS type A sorting domain-containing protein [bacterium]|nr:T9SS type A sorting domain-containing protein [bacterium]
MKRLMTLLLLLVFILVAHADEIFQTAQTHDNFAQPLTGMKASAKARHLDEVVYIEDWESSLNGWESVDLTATPGTWHIDSWMAYGGTGMAWCMGEHPIYCDTVGYNNDWYMVLNSPPIDLPAGTVTLTFQSRIGCELPAGADPPYNGWDGCNLRISTDGGNNWVVIGNSNVEPDYDNSSLYSFGFQHGEGANVPGWTGQHFNWFQTTVDLSTWAGQVVYLRWAFASDPSWCTCDASDRRWAFGWQVDDILIMASDTVLYNDGTDNTGWVSGTNRPVAGDLWRVADDCTPPPCPPPSGSHYLACNGAGNLTYNDDMNNELISPYIDMRELDFGTVVVDFYIAGLLGSNPDNFPDCDFWHWEVSPDSGATWCFASNPYCEGLPNYVHPDAPNVWALYSEAYLAGFEISDYIGRVIKLKAVMESNSDGIGGVGPCFDDITITYSSGFPNDFSCYTLQLRFPTNEIRPAYGTAYFSNEGSLAPPGPVACWWRVEGGSMQRLMPNLDIGPGGMDTRNFTWTPAAAGDASISAWTALNVDENLGNDTSYCTSIVVRGETADLEMGYDNRTTQYAFNFDIGNGALVKFTPEADSIDLPVLVKTIRAQFDGSQTTNIDFTLHIYDDNADAPGTEVHTQVVTVTTSDILPAWKEIILTSWLTVDGDFWVWFEVENADHFPKMIGDDGEPWANHDHFHTWGGSGTPSNSAYFYTVRAQVAAGVAAEINNISPTSYSLAQNYPNPFNPVTDIHYSIAHTDQVTLRVFNVLGQEVAVLVDGLQTAGLHNVSFDGANLPSGVYIYRLETPNFSSARKMLLLK